MMKCTELLHRWQTPSKSTTAVLSVSLISRISCLCFHRCQHANVERTGASQRAGEASVLSARLGAPLRWKIEGTRLVIKLPLARGELCVELADPALPEKILLGHFMPPEGIDINHGKCCVFLLGN